MSFYRYLLADLRTNAILAELPFTGVRFTQLLNNAGTFSGRLQISDLRETGYDIQGVTIPSRTAIYVDRDGVLVWGGVIWLRTYDSNTQSINVSAREFMSYFERRRISATTVFQNVDQLNIARSLINTAQSVTGGNIGITQSSNTSGVNVTRVYFDYELKDLFSAIKDLSNANDGFDFAVDVFYDSTGTPIKRLNYGYPQRGRTYIASDPDALVFELPGNLVDYEWPDDGAVTANKLYGIGPQSNEAKIIATAIAPADTVAAGYPLLEDSTTYNDQYDPTLLYQQTLSEVTARQYPVVTIKVTIPAYVSPVLGSYITGDECLLRITDARWPQPSGGGFGYAATKRIVSITVEPGEDGPERVTLVLIDP